jgi:hypothetical protein
VLLRDPYFMGLSLIGGFGVASFFAYLANSSFVLINHYGLTPRQFSIAFAANAASFIGVSQLTGRLGARFGLARMVRWSVTLVDGRARYHCRHRVGVGRHAALHGRHPGDGPAQPVRQWRAGADVVGDRGQRGHRFRSGDGDLAAVTAIAGVE